MEKQFGFFSAEMAKEYGYCYYLTPEGKEVKVNYASEDPEAPGIRDKVFVSEVVKHLRGGLKDNSSLDMLSFGDMKPANHYQTLDDQD